MPGESYARRHAASGGLLLDLAAVFAVADDRQLEVGALPEGDGQRVDENIGPLVQLLQRADEDEAGDRRRAHPAGAAHERLVGKRDTRVARYVRGAPGWITLLQRACRDVGSGTGAGTLVLE